MPSLNHFNLYGEAHMVDIGDKPISQRTAITEGYIQMQPDTLQLIMDRAHEKGDVLGIARLAGIMACKKTADLIPLCHPLPITHVDIELSPETGHNRVRCQTTVKTNHQTGVEMEALVATSNALLTIYDMCKGVDRGMTITAIRLLEKQGGQSGHWQQPIADV